MERQQLQERIEQYLNDTLSSGEREAFEKRLKEDAVLRQELELQRRMQADFDAARLQLRINLQKIMEEPCPPRRNIPWWLWLLGLLAMLMFAWNIPPIPPPTEVPTLPPPEQLSIPAPDSKPATDQGSRPMAEADPARFKPNPGMEAFVKGNVRSESIDVKLTSPRNGVELKPDNKGLSSIRFIGFAIAPDGMKPKGFMLSVFDNRDANKPVFVTPLPVQDAVEGRLKFDLRQQFQFKPGLYYFTVEAKDAGEVLYAGKFFIRQ